MVDEHKDATSQWTLETLYLYVDRRFDEQEKRLDERYETQTKAVEKAFSAADLAVQAALKSAEKAVSKAEAASDKRFESVNEFRATLADQTHTFITRAEAEGAIARNSERIQDLADRFNKSEGRGAGLNAGWVYALGALAAFGTIVSLVLAFSAMR